MVVKKLAVNVTSTHILISVEGGIMMIYTIGELAELASISTRTLRYYDEIGLVTPKTINQAGHRLYGQAEVDLLQQVMFYRALRVDLKTIQDVLHDPDVSIVATLTTQYEALKAEHQRIEKLLITLEQTLQSHKGERVMTDEEKFEAFKKQVVSENDAQYGAETRKAYGDDIVQASQAKMMGMDEPTYQEFQALDAQLTHDLLLAAVQTQNVKSAEAKAKALVMRHRDWLLYTWTTYTPEAHCGLADMYLADERFTDYYNASIPGGTQFLHDAIHTWAHQLDAD